MFLNHHDLNFFFQNTLPKALPNGEQLDLVFHIKDYSFIVNLQNFCKITNCINVYLEVV